MLQISAFFLGCVRVEVNHQPIQVDTRKALALFSFLLITGRTHSRDRLATMLWPESSQTSARGALRRTLSSLRKEIGGEALVTTNDEIGLRESADLWCDATRFRQLIRQVADYRREHDNLSAECLLNLTKAVDLYQGDFMAGFSLRDSLDFDNWQFQEAELFRRELSEVVVQLSEYHSEQLDYVLALTYAQRWLSLEPLNEAVHRRIMEIYALSGRRDAALRQYRECVRILETELGVPPLDETTELYERIKIESRASPTITRGQSSSIIVSGRVKVDISTQLDQLSEKSENVPLFPFVGRENELQEIKQLFSNAHPDGFLLGITGEAGIGKTRLVEEFLTSVSTPGGRSIIVRCYEGEGNLAFAPISALLRNGLQNIRKDNWWENVPAFARLEAVRLVPEMAEILDDAFTLPPMEGPGSQARFYEGVSQVLFALAMSDDPKFPGLIFIDDLQWADEASLDLLIYLFRRFRGKSLFCLVTMQEFPSKLFQHIKTSLISLEREQKAKWIHLERLSEADSERLFDAVTSIGGHVHPEWHNRLYQETEGNPFFLTAYLQSLTGENFIEGHDQVWTPETIQDMLQSRVSVLNPFVLQVLQSAAVIGRSFDWITLLETGGRGEEETIQALEELITQGFIRELPGSETETIYSIKYDFNHEKIRRFVCDEISLPRMRLLHRRIAQSLSRHLQIRDDALSGKIAWHYHQAGELELAADYYYKAGETARKVFANREALSHYEAALALGYQERFKLFTAMGEIQMLNANYTAAISCFQNAASLSEKENQALAEWKLGQVYDRMGDWCQVENQYQMALEALGNNNLVMQSAIYSDWSLTCHRQGESDRAEELSQKALDRAMKAGDKQALAQSHNLLGILARNRGDLPTSRGHLEKSLLFSEEISLPAFKVAALNNLALVRQDLHDLGGAKELVEQALAICERMGDRHREAALRNHLADLLQASGKIEAAIEQLKIAVEIFAEIGGKVDDWLPEIWKLTEW